MMTYRHNDMSRLIVLTLVLAAGLLAGCVRDVPEIKEEKSEIAVTTNLTPMRKRANTIDGISDLRACDLRIDAYYNGTTTPYLSNEKLHYNAAWMFWNSSTSTQLHYYWPIEGSVYDPTGVNITVSSLDFVGCCPYTAPDYITSGPSYNAGVSFSCDVSSYMTLARQNGDEAPAIPEMQEYLVAVLNNQTYADQEEHGGVPLEFKHPFALVKFVITAASGEHVQINSISINGLYTHATCTYNGSTMNWGSYDDETKATMTITPDEPLKYGTSSTETVPFMVIPKNYDSKYLTVNATWDEWSNVTISDYGTNVDFSWEPGRIYTYNLTLDKYGLIVDVDKFTEQW